MKHRPCNKQYFTWISLEIYNDNNQQFKRHDFQKHFLSWPKQLLKFGKYLPQN